MVLLDRIELSASPLPRECSTTELQQHRARMRRTCTVIVAYCHSLAVYASPFPHFFILLPQPMAQTSGSGLTIPQA